MKNITNDYKNEVKLFGRQIDSKITYELDGETIELGKSELNSVSPHYESDILKSTMKQLDIDSNVEIPLNTILNYQFGVLVNNQYEYINYGNYVVYKAEKQEDTRSWKITCYDKMLYSMKDYVNIGVTYPITIRDYINAICEYLGLVFKNKNDEFANYDKEIQNELYLNNAGESLDYTFRDVFDELAQVTASTICINEDDDELEIRYINDLINETNEVEGTNISINDNVGDKLLDLELQGNTTQDGTPTPDSPVNIDVVTGRQEIDVVGKNLLDNTNYSLGMIDENGKDAVSTVTYRFDTYNPVKPNATIHLLKPLCIYYYDKNKNFISLDVTGVLTRTTPSDCAYARFRTFASDFSTFNSDDYMVSYETITGYEPYQGKSYEVNLGKNLLPTNESFWEQGSISNNGSYINRTTVLRTTDFINIDGTIDYYISIQNENYTFVNLMGYSQDGTFKAVYYNTDINIYGTRSLKINFNNSDVSKIKVLLRKSDDSTITPSEISSIEPMIEKGSVATSYSPYFTPIELCKIGDYQDYIRKSTGKNLFDKDNANVINSAFINGSTGVIETDNNSKLIYIPCKSNATYTISKIVTSRFRVSYSSDEPILGVTTSGVISNYSGTSITITTGANANYLVVWAYNSGLDSMTFEDVLKTLQIEENSQATDLEPYGVGKWYICKKIKKLDMSTITSWGGIGNGGFYYVNFVNTYKISADEILSNIFTYSSTNWDGVGKFGITSTGNLWLMTGDSTLTSETLPAWLENKNAYMYGILSSPTIEEITNQELIEQLESIELLEGVNNITISSENLPSSLKLTYITEYESINEEYLKDINVNFGEKYGPVNSIVLSRASESDNVYLRNENSIIRNGLCEIKIKENQIMNFNDRSDYLPDLLEKLNGLQYYINDFSSTGITFYEVCDKYRIKIGENTYSCIMFNDETNITQGLEELVHTDMPEGSETDYKKADKTDRKINQTYIIADKQQGQIEALTSQTTTLEDEMRNRYTIDQVNQLIQNAETGVTNTFSEAGGNNIFRNTGLWFQEDSYNVDTSYVSQRYSELLCILNGRQFNKANNDIAFVAYYYGDNGFTGPILVGYTPESVIFYSENNVFGGEEVTYNDRTYYVSSTAYFMGGNQTSTDGKANKLSDSAITREQAVNTMLQMIDNYNPYEFWNGSVIRKKEDLSSNGNALLLQNGKLFQKQDVSNGNYTISFKYKKLIELANVKCVINDIEYTLDNTEETEFIQTIQVNSQHIDLQFITNTNNSCEVYDLMVNAGTVKLAYSQNQNETKTDTVNISKGITITSSDTETTFRANADGIRTLDKNGNRLTEFTDTGMINKTMTVEDEATIVDILIQRVGNHTWMTKI